MWSGPQPKVVYRFSQPTLGVWRSVVSSSSVVWCGSGPRSSLVVLVAAVCCLGHVNNYDWLTDWTPATNDLRGNSNRILCDFRHVLVHFGRWDQQNRKYEKILESLNSTRDVEYCMPPQCAVTVPAYVIPPWPWPSTFWPQIVVRLSLSHDSASLA